MHPNILNKNQLVIVQKLKLPKAPGFYLAGVAAMKLAAIIQRGTRRDFIDIYFLLNFYTLGELINFAIKKYPGYQQMLILRALIYLEDAEKEKYPRPIKVLDPDFSWEKAKKKIFAEVKQYQLSILKKR